MVTLLAGGLGGGPLMANPLAGVLAAAVGGCLSGFLPQGPEPGSGVGCRRGLLVPRGGRPLAEGRALDLSSLPCPRLVSGADDARETTSEDASPTITPLTIMMARPSDHLQDSYAAGRIVPWDDPTVHEPAAPGSVESSTTLTLQLAQPTTYTPLENQ